MSESKTRKYLKAIAKRSEQVKEESISAEQILSLEPLLKQAFGIVEGKREFNKRRGATKTNHYLKSIADSFNDPTYLVNITPLAHAYLGEEIFSKAIEVILERAKQHPGEQDMLDEVLTSTALLQPELRETFLDSVRTAPYLDHELFGLESLLDETDPNLKYGTTDELPPELQTGTPLSAVKALLNFINKGFFIPGDGFTEEYKHLEKTMCGLDYMFKEPEKGYALLIGPRVRGLDIETTPSFDARPNNSGENPEIVIINKDTEPQKIMQLYPSSTLVYLAVNKKELSKIRKVAEEDHIIYPPEGVILKELVPNIINFISRNRGDASIDVKDIIGEVVKTGLEFAQEQDETFYDVDDELKTIGKADALSLLIKENGLKLPKRTTSYLSKVKIRPKSEDKRRKLINTNLESIDKLNLDGARTYGAYVVEAHDFVEWAKLAQEQTEPDTIRSYIYYGYQPLFDALLSGGMDDATREVAVDILDKLKLLGIGFHKDYYKGRPNVKAFKASMRQIQRKIEKLKAVSYHRKGTNDISPHFVRNFIQGCTSYTMQNGLADLVIGTCCGSSEPAMSLAGFLETDFVSMRKSKRRGDGHVKIISEHEEEIKRKVKGRNVICVEDYVVTSRSLGSIMEKAKQLGAKDILGASVGLNGGGYLNMIKNQTGFHLYRLQ